MNPLGLMDDHDVQADHLLEVIASTSDDAVIRKTLSGVVETWNAAAERLYGFTAAEMIGHDISVLFPSERRHELDDLLARARRGETVRALSTLRVRKDGTPIEVSITVAPVRNSDGAVVGVATIARDQAEHDRARLAEAHRPSAESLSFLETLLESAPVGFGFVDRDFRIIRENEMLAAVNGSSALEQVGRTVAEVRPMIWPQVEAIYRHVLENDEAVLNIEVTGEIAAEPGQPRHWLVSYYPVHLAGEVIGIGLVAIDVTERKKSEEEHDQLMRGAIAAIAATTEARDPYTAGHQRRVAEIAGAIATELALDPAEVDGIRLAANIHDIGKISIPIEILARPGRLTAIEWEMVKCHSEAGYDILADIKFPWPIATMILQHHERLDGSGYPAGLRGNEIVLGARIIAVADTVEAMASHRPYRPAVGLGAALQEIEQQRGILFDPQVVEACLRLFREGRFAIGESSQWARAPSAPSGS